MDEAERQPGAGYDCGGQSEILSFHVFSFVA